MGRKNKDEHDRCTLHIGRSINVLYHSHSASESPPPSQPYRIPSVRKGEQLAIAWGGFSQSASDPFIKTERCLILLHSNPIQSRSDEMHEKTYHY